MRINKNGRKIKVITLCGSTRFKDAFMEAGQLSGKGDKVNEGNYLCQHTSWQYKESGRSDCEKL
jgi:hypothetical protein